MTGVCGAATVSARHDQSLLHTTFQQEAEGFDDIAFARQQLRVIQKQEV
jgi:hypothetical protein